MSFDADYHARLKYLAELMIAQPRAVMTDLKREALDAYPLTNNELRRRWFSVKTSDMASDIASDMMGSNIS